MGMVEEDDLPADERDGSFEDGAVEGHGAVFGHPAAGLAAEVVLQVEGRLTQALDAGGEAAQGWLAGAPMDAGVVGFRDPHGQGGVEVVEGFRCEGGQELLANGAEPSFHLAPSLGLVGW